MARARLRGARGSLTCGLIVMASGCGGGEFSTNPVSGKTGGAAGSADAGTGGRGAGGSVNGGASGSGGRVTSGGASGSGGVVVDGGTGGATGGAPNSGGARNSGGASNGGASGGGTSSGGAQNSGGAPTGGAPSSGGTSGSGGQGGTGGVGPPDGGGCTVATADRGGVFVDEAAANSIQDGTMSAPYATLDIALQKAFDNGITTLYIAMGSYKGTTVGGFSKTLTLSGGWTTDSNGWTRGCNPGLRDRTIITAPSETTPGLFLNANQATVRLEVLTVRTMDGASSQSGSAGSLHGIVLQGPDGSPSLALDDVVVAAGRGADAPSPATVGASGNLACNGRSDCPTVVADGVEGGAGALAMKGMFGPLGYMPADGQPGTPGTDGTNGTKGTPGTTCTGCKGGCQGLFPLCSAGNAPNVSGTSGLCGCGGIGGPPGAPGRGGGASVALLVSGQATVVATNSLLRSSRGGDASSGADGGDPGLGTIGAHGTGASCATDIKCTSGGQCAFGGTLATCTASPGQPGAAGHPGGVGGPGGGGWGGPSYSVVLIGQATFTPTATTLDFGNSGKNGDGSVASGNAGMMLTQ